MLHQIIYISRIQQLFNVHIVFANTSKSSLKYYGYKHTIEGLENDKLSRGLFISFKINYVNNYIYIVYLKIHKLYKI